MSPNRILGKTLGEKLGVIFDYEFIEFIPTGRDSEYVFNTNKGKYKYISTGELCTMHKFNGFQYELLEPNQDIRISTLLNLKK